MCAAASYTIDRGGDNRAPTTDRGRKRHGTYLVRQGSGRCDPHRPMVDTSARHRVRRDPRPAAYRASDDPAVPLAGRPRRARPTAGGGGGGGRRGAGGGG